MIRGTAPSRLHFGLFQLPTEPARPTMPARSFGGVGLMIDKPGVALRVDFAAKWLAAGPLADRALAFAQTLLGNVAADLGTALSADRMPAFKITVEHCAREHVGLGTGTQLGLAVARALAVALGRPDWDASFLAQRIGRGHRSALGVHGFQKGGFMVDGGKGTSTALAPLIVHHDFPQEWGILVVVPRDIQGAHGDQEGAAFARLARCDADTQRTESLCRLVLLGMLPALVERDLRAFGDALYEFNRRVGEMFEPWQGGVYAHARTPAFVEYFRGNGIHGVGQSSWGPAVFAIGEMARLEQLREPCRTRFALATDEIFLCNGAQHYNGERRA